MITSQNLQDLKEAETNGATLSDVIATAEKEVALQEARDQAGAMVFNMAEYFNARKNEGVFDDILGDINALIDRTQELMAKEQVGEQSDGSVIIDTPEDGIEISTEEQPQEEKTTI